MDAPSIHTGPALAAESPPAKKLPEPLRRNEHDQISAQIELCKAWLRASPQARRELLQDVKFAHPQLWDAVNREALP
jgi:hypothetical protein